MEDYANTINNTTMQNKSLKLNRYVLHTLLYSNISPFTYISSVKLHKHKTQNPAPEVNAVFRSPLRILET